MQLQERNETPAEWLNRLGTDAKKWAEEFMRTFAHRKQEIDEATMIAWFANAIERTRSEEHWKTPEYKQKIAEIIRDSETTI